MHRACLETWQQAKKGQQESVTCPLCRATWTATTSRTQQRSTAYLNLAAYSTTNHYDEDDDDDERLGFHHF
jgi:Zn-finger nucleic acid-binding protein